MKKWNLIIDVEKCEDCNNCFLACKDEHVDNEWPGDTLSQPTHGQRWMNIMRKERGQYPLIDVAYRPTPCMHCNSAPCVKLSKGAVRKRPDGIVIIDPVKSKGQKDLVNVCPYQRIYWNEEKQVPQKCTLCAHLLDEGWKQPRCVQACPTGALRAECIEVENIERIINDEKLEVLNPEFNTSPTVYYKNLYRFNKCFIAGSIATEAQGIVDCADGAVIKLFKGKAEIARTESDSFGDFKFDKLDESSGSYTLEIDFPGYKKSVFEVSLETSTSLKEVRLEKD